MKNDKEIEELKHNLHMKTDKVNELENHLHNEVHKVHEL